MHWLFLSKIRKGDKLWYMDQQVEVVSRDGPYVTVRFLTNGQEDSMHHSNLETQQHPFGTFTTYRNDPDPDGTRNFGRLPVNLRVVK